MTNRRGWPSNGSVEFPWENAAALQSASRLALYLGPKSFGIGWHSCGLWDRVGHAENGMALDLGAEARLATNDSGWIELVTDGERLWVVMLGQPDTKRVRWQTAQIGKALIRPQAFSEDSVP